MGDGAVGFEGAGTGGEDFSAGLEVGAEFVGHRCVDGDGVGEDEEFVGGPVGVGADDVEEPAQAFALRLDEALRATEPLTYGERRARAGVVSRQLTLR